MIPPAKLFCELLANLPDEVRREAATFGCAAIGHYSFATDETVFEELEARIVALTKDQGLMDEFVINGLFVHLLNYFARLSHKETMSSFIDNELDLIERLEADLTKPQSDRSYKADDDDTKRFIARLKEIANQRPRRREIAQKVVEQLQGYLKDHFGPEYWEERMHRRMEHFRGNLPTIELDKGTA